MIPLRPFNKTLLLLAVIFVSSHSFAQAIVTTNTPPVLTSVPKFRPPVVKSFLGGGYTGDTTMSVEVAKTIIGLPLTVRDKKNNFYTITHYGFAYKRVGVTEDEETGAVSPETDVVADEFTTTPLPAIWTKTIIETLHKGEVLSFYDIIVKDSKGNIFFAPGISFTMQ
jgi:hypothetical protein